MRLLRLRGRKVCDRVLRNGNAWKGRHMIIRWLPGHPRHPAAKHGSEAIYVGTLASTKLDKSAVRRNRMRRRCREALRTVILQKMRKLKKLSEDAGLVGPAAEDTAEGKGGSVGGTPLGGPPTITQLLIAPRSSSLDAPFAALEQDIENFLSSRPHARSPEAR